MTVRLVINADDFGYFDGISAGILDAVVAGTVTATGVIANGAAFAAWSERLRPLSGVDVGVHLNVTHGEPLTSALKGRLPAGALPGKVALAAHLMTGRIPLSVIEDEWKAQIELCIAAGLRIRFLNSHEHVHMFPPLYRVIRDLAAEFGIRHVRYTRPEFDASLGAAGALRSVVISVSNLVLPRPTGEPEFLGLAPSGRLDMRYVQRLLPRLRTGSTYELMCHPGRDDPVAASSPTLSRYHDWAGELTCLLDGQFRDLLAAHSIDLVRFRDLDS